MMNTRDMIPWTGGRSRLPSLFRDEPGSLFATLRQEVDRLFDEAFRGFGAPMTRFAGFGTGWPSVELAETDKEIRVSVEIPGVDEKDIEVLLDDGDLVVRGEKRSAIEDKDRRFTERYYGRFERRIPLGQEVQEDAIRAEFRNGVLEVTVPRPEQATQRTRRIPVRTAAASA